MFVDKKYYCNYVVKRKAAASDEDNNAVGRTVEINKKAKPDSSSRVDRSNDNLLTEAEEKAIGGSLELLCDYSSD